LLLPSKEKVKRVLGYGTMTSEKAALKREKILPNHITSL
jgi:hypothetical protein